MLQYFLNLIFPKNCYGCKDILLNSAEFICTKCLHNLDFIPVGKNSNPTIINRFYGKLPLTNANALLYYDKKEISHNLIFELKYKNHQEVGTFFAEIAFEKFKETNVFKNVDELVALPLHPKKEKMRGYNQLDSFGNRLSELTQIPYNKKRLSRNFHTSSQTKKNIFTRSTLKKDLFTVHFSENDHGKHFLILDDVITTGSTLEILGKELLKVPESKISAFFMTYTKQ